MINVPFKYIDDFANAHDCPLVDPQEMRDDPYYNLIGCLPTSEQDEVTEMDIQSEREEDQICWDIFNGWDSNYLRGFCPSIRDRVVVGAYMSLHSLSEIEVGS